MIDLVKLNPLKRKRLTSLLGFVLDGSRLDGVVLRRNTGALEVLQTFSVSLSLDPLTADAELVGQEIRNHLDAAGIRERHCIAGVPLKWALTSHVEVPSLPEQDLASFLQLEAERGFHCDVETLHFATSHCHLPSGKQDALLVGIPKNHLALLERALRAAKLKPVSFSLGIVALQPPVADPAQGVLAVTIGETSVGLQVSSGGGVSALRALDAALEIEGSRRILHADLVAREARITLGQLPADLRETVRGVRIFGPRDLAQQLADELELRLDSMGLKIELPTRYAPGEFGLQLPSETPISPQLSLAAGHLAGRKPPFELLPPRVTAWQQMAARYSSGKLRLAGAAAGAAVLLILGAFLFQQWQLTRLGSRWAGIQKKVKELDSVQQQIRQFRPWYDDSVRALTILRQLTAAFPKDGVVSARTVEIRDLSVVTCTGTTRDNDALLKTLDRLRAGAGVSDVKVTQIRGTKPPLQFTFDFHWNEGGKSEN